MDKFFNALASTERNRDIPEEFDYFGKLIGSWKVDYVNAATSETIKGEWHFARILEGMAIQDVIVLPSFEYGTTVRVFDPNAKVWDVAYCYAGNIIRLEARKSEEKIVLTDVDNARRKWVFAEIGDDRFHWQDIRVETDGNWRAIYDIYAERI